MRLVRAGSTPTMRAPAGAASGDVWQDPIIEAPSPARLKALRVTFAPGARTAWHTHPLGQTLVVLAGVGRCQSEGGPVKEIRAGDVIWIAPGENHWHGAAPTTMMTHLAMQEMQDGAHVAWTDSVSDADYGAAPTSD